MSRFKPKEKNTKWFKTRRDKLYIAAIGRKVVAGPGFVYFRFIPIGAGGRIILSAMSKVVLNWSPCKLPTTNAHALEINAEETCSHIIRGSDPVDQPRGNCTVHILYVVQIIL